MKNSEIKVLYQGIMDLISDSNLKLDAQTSFYIAKNKLALEPIYTLIQDEERKIWMKYGKVNEKTGDLTVPIDSISSWEKEMNELLSIENEIDIKQIELEKFNKVEISISTMQKIIKMIKEA